MKFKVSYGTSMWAYVLLDTDNAGFDELEDNDDRSVALASYIVRECIEDADGWATFTMDDVIVTDIYGESTRQGADTLEPPLPDNHGNFGALIDQCETLVLLHDLIEGNEHSVDRLLATIEHQGWDSFDFDDTKYWDDEYFTEFGEGDYEAFAREEMEICDMQIESRLEHYFDFGQYGRDTIRDSYYEQTFNGVTYVFNMC